MGTTFSSTDTELGALPFMPSRRDALFIVAFWTAYALLTLANRFFDPGGVPVGPASGRVVVAVTESFGWTLLTFPLFWFSARAVAAGGPAPLRRIAPLASLSIAALAAAVVMGWLGTNLRATFTPMPVVPRPIGAAGPALPPTPLFWFGFINAVIISLGVTAAGVARAYSIRYRNRREQTITLAAQLSEARLEALRRQLDPHFLFNTLNAVSSLVERDPRGVRRMIARLGELLRYSFEAGGEPEVPLSQELSLLSQYVDIMQVRFQGKLDVRIAVDSAIMDSRVPGLILQPLVENAIKHGVERRTSGGRIDVTGIRDGSFVVLTVSNETDDAAGIARPESDGAGVGLRNTMARLQQLYGSTQHFSLTSADGCTVAELRLPHHV